MLEEPVGVSGATYKENRDMTIECDGVSVILRMTEQEFKNLVGLLKTASSEQRFEPRLQIVVDHLTHIDNAIVL